MAQPAANDPAYVALQQALLHTFSPDENARKEAEKRIDTLRSTPGNLPVLLQVVSDAANTDRTVRQAAAISLKNIIMRHWEQKDDDPGVFPDDRNTIRENIMEVLVREQDSSVRDILAEAVNNIAGYDFPDSWQSYLPSIVNNIHTKDQLRIYNALVSLRKVVKRFEYKPKDKRAPLNLIVDTVFPCHSQESKRLRALDLH